MGACTNLLGEGETRNRRSTRVSPGSHPRAHPQFNKYNCSPLFLILPPPLFLILTLEPRVATSSPFPSSHSHSNLLLALAFGRVLFPFSPLPRLRTGPRLARLPSFRLRPSLPTPTLDFALSLLTPLPPLLPTHNHSTTTACCPPTVSASPRESPSSFSPLLPSSPPFPPSSSLPPSLTST